MEVRKAFEEVYSLIVSARKRAYRAVNKELIDLYWKVGEYISYRVNEEDWGKGIVKELSSFLKREEPGLKGFSQQNLWRMKQFYEAYAQSPKLSPLVRELSWTNNMVILARTNDEVEREFYLRLAARENYSKRTLERAISTFTYERAIASDQKLSPVARELNPGLEGHFKDLYVLDFLNLPERHSEQELQKAILSNLKSFILELGSDFSFIGEEYRYRLAGQISSLICYSTTENYNVWSQLN